MTLLISVLYHCVAHKIASFYQPLIFSAALYLVLLLVVMLLKWCCVLYTLHRGVNCDHSFLLMCYASLIFYTTLTLPLYFLGNLAKPKRLLMFVRYASLLHFASITGKNIKTCSRVRLSSVLVPFKLSSHTSKQGGKTEKGKKYAASSFLHQYPRINKLKG